MALRGSSVSSAVGDMLSESRALGGPELRDLPALLGHDRHRYDLDMAVRLGG